MPAATRVGRAPRGRTPGTASPPTTMRAGAPAHGSASTPSRVKSQNFRPVGAGPGPGQGPDPGQGLVRDNDTQNPGLRTAAMGGHPSPCETATRWRSRRSCSTSAACWRTPRGPAGSSGGRPSSGCRSRSRAAARARRAARVDRGGHAVRGRASDRERVRARRARRWGRFMDDLWAEYLGTLNEELTAYFASLRWAVRYRTGIVSNSFVGAREREQAAVRVRGSVRRDRLLHEGVAASPTPGSTRSPCERLGVSADRTVFLDDVQANVDGALAVGLEGILFVDTEQAIGELRSRLERDGTERRGGWVLLHSAAECRPPVS